MRKNGHFLNLIFIVSALIPVIPRSADAADLVFKSTKDWTQLFEKCENSWDKYDADLSRLRSSLQREVDQMTRDEYLKRWRENDATIRYIRIHWPAIFAAKDQGWAFYQACSDGNWKVRKNLTSASASKKEKLEAIKELEECIGAIFPGVPFPFDRLLTCYRKQANR